MASGLLFTLAWLIAWCGPPLLAIWSWHGLSKRIQPWIAHSIFLPAAVGLEWLSANSIFYATGDTGDGPPGLGLALIVTFATLVGTIAIYYCALAWIVVRKWMIRREN